MLLSGTALYWAHVSLDLDDEATFNLLDRYMFKKLFFASSIFLTPLMALAGGIEGRVVNVLDGDTVQVLAQGNNTFRVRLYGIDAPEKDQPWGQQSKKYLIKTVASKTVSVTGDAHDHYGRLLGTLWLNGEDVNASMVSAGYAWAYRYKGIATVTAYAALENTARNNAIGLWQDKEPVEPFQWRKLH